MTKTLREEVIYLVVTDPEGESPQGQRRNLCPRGCSLHDAAPSSWYGHRTQCLLVLLSVTCWLETLGWRRGVLFVFLVPLLH